MSIQAPAIISVPLENNNVPTLTDPNDIDWLDIDPHEIPDNQN